MTEQEYREALLRWVAVAEKYEAALRQIAGHTWDGKPSMAAEVAKAVLED